jgi:hypothetical protein
MQTRPVRQFKERPAMVKRHQISALLIIYSKLFKNCSRSSQVTGSRKFDLRKVVRVDGTISRLSSIIVDEHDKKVVFFACLCPGASFANEALIVGPRAIQGC